MAILTRLPLVAALFLAGLAGSLTHCATMCSGFVLAQSKTLPLSKPDWSSRLLLPYHLGRMTTYAALGALAGFAFHFVASWPPFFVVRHLMLAIVAVIFLAVFAERLLGKFGVVLPRLPGLKPRCALNAMAQVGQVQSAAGRFGLGLALGLLPCPLIFAALIAVAARADPWTGAAAMAAFALGTMPALMGLGLAGHQLFRDHPRVRDGLTLTALGINGVALLALAANG